MHIDTLPTGVGYLYSAQKSWDHNPTYQRPGGQWDIRQKQKFIDSILNNFPVPPIYLHKTGTYAVIDGKQRLETIREFIDGKFDLALDFVLMEKIDRDGGAPLPGDGWQEFTDKWRTHVLSYNIPVVEVAFANDENAEALVRQIFLRLNSGTKISFKHMEQVLSQLKAHE